MRVIFALTCDVNQIVRLPERFVAQRQEKQKMHISLEFITSVRLDALHYDILQTGFPIKRLVIE